MAFSVIVLGLILSNSWRSGAEYVNFLSDEYIANLNKQDLPWEAGRNFPANLTLTDVERMFGPKPTPGILPEYPGPHERRKTYGSALKDIPDAFDARQHFNVCAPIISVIPDQGPCASSYAFSIPSVASDRLCIASKGKVKKLLSAEYVNACCKMCRYPDQTKACFSGLSSATWAWIHKRGLVTGGGYKSNIGCQPVSFAPCNHSPSTSSSLPSCDKLPTPQPKCHTRCTNENYSRGFFQDKIKFKKYYWLSEKVSDIQEEIIANGPVVANFYIYSDFLNYKSGVYVTSADATILVYASAKIIGWGVEKNQPYWTVVSTLGENWGDAGTFKILRGHNTAIIESLVNAAAPRGKFNSHGYDSRYMGEDDDDDESLEGELNEEKADNY